eukprot:1091691-Pleurochrysis_carterae.AAC.1
MHFAWTKTHDPACMHGSWHLASEFIGYRRRWIRIDVARALLIGAFRTRRNLGIASFKYKEKEPSVLHFKGKADTTTNRSDRPLSTRKMS